MFEIVEVRFMIIFKYKHKYFYKLHVIHTLKYWI